MFYSVFVGVVEEAPPWLSPERAKYTNSGRSPEKKKEEDKKP